MSDINRRRRCPHCRELMEWRIGTTRFDPHSGKRVKAGPPSGVSRFPACPKCRKPYIAKG